MACNLPAIDSPRTRQYSATTFQRCPTSQPEIRAPAGTLPGVSSFQLHFANYDIMTPGDRPDVLVAMNPAALKANIDDLPRGGVIITDSADFTKRNLAKVGYDSDPLTDGSLEDYQVHALDLTGMTLQAVKNSASPARTPRGPRTCLRSDC